MGALTLPGFLGSQTFGNALGGLGLVHGIANSHAAASQAQAQAAAQAQAMQAQAAHQRELLDRQHASETRRRANLLERATARTRVSFGARGLAPTDGSAGALLDGLQAGFGIEEAEHAQDYEMRRAGLDRGLADSLQRVDFARQRNLLDAESDVQRRILGLLNWGTRRGGQGGKGHELLPVEARFEDYDPFA